MPTINDVMEMAELLQTKSVVAVEDHCVAVRNRNATCRKCADVCIADAFTIEKNQLIIDASACVACGACVAVCPTDALVSLDPMREDLAVSVANAVKQAESMAVIACARMASRQVGDPDKFATVPCLGRVTEELLVSLAAHGVEDIVLVDGTCSTCKYGKVSPAVDATVDVAASLLELVESPTIITRCSEFPPELKVADARKAIGAARRGFFTQAGGYAKNVTMTVAEKAVADALHQNQKQKLNTLRDRLGAGKSGKMPTFKPERNMRLLDGLYEIGEATGKLDSLMDGADESVVSTRHFATMAIDPQTCSGCGMCVMFCPTEAVKHSTLEEPENEEMRYLEFQAADCTQCHLCTDVCLRSSITLSSEVAASELFDFEPRLLEIPRPKKNSLFTRRH